MRGPNPLPLPMVDRISPNAQQQAVLDSRSRYNILHGNAGSAKSTTLALKILDALRHGVSASSILALTYSDAAVLALRQRLRWLGLSREQVLQIRTTTFNQLCQERLEAIEGPSTYLKQPNRQVFDTVLRAIEIARRRAQQRGHAEAFDIAGEGTLLVPGLLHAFRRLKGTMELKSLGPEFVLTPGSAQDAGLDFTPAAVLLAYEQLRAGLGMEPAPAVPSSDEDGLEIKGRDGHAGARPSFRDSLGPIFRLADDPFYDMACALTADEPLYPLDAHPLCLGTRLLLVDEGHDLNRAMFTVMQHLVEANPVEQVFVVGDADQVVHSDAGAEATFMGDAFTAGVGQAAQLRLDKCWRFGEALAGPLGRHAGKSYRVEEGRQTQVEVLQVPSAKAHAKLIVGAYQAALDAGESQTAGLAVLLRHPGESVQLENELALQGYSFEPHGFEPSSRRPEVIFLRTLVAWATSAVPTLTHCDVTAVQQAIAEFTGCMRDQRLNQVQYRGLDDLARFMLGDVEAFVGQRVSAEGASLLLRSDQDALNAVRSFVARLRAGVLPAELTDLVHQAGFEGLAKRAFVFEEDVDEAMRSMLEFARTAQSFGSLESWLQQMASREYAMSRRNGRARQAVRFYTIAAAKGLEFDHVIVPGVSAGVFEGAQQEERNLFYVAASRARKKLTLTYEQRPSRYLEGFGRVADWGELT